MLRRRPLMRAAATTAVVAGTATAVSGRVRRRQEGNAQQEADAQAYQDQQAAMAQQQAYQQQQAYAAQQQAYAPPPAPAPAAGGLAPDAIQQLQALAALKDQGILTEEEFAAQKAKVLAS